MFSGKPQSVLEFRYTIIETPPLPKTTPSRVQCVFFAVWRACKASSRVQWQTKECTLSCSVGLFSLLLFFLPAACTTSSQREKKRSSPSRNIKLFSCTCFECTTLTSFVHHQREPHLKVEHHALMHISFALIAFRTQHPHPPST